MSHIKVFDLSEAENELLAQNYEASKQGNKYIRTKPGNCMLPIAYLKHKQRIYNLKVTTGDLFVFGWIKTGTTWMREMVWCIMNQCDIEEAKKSTLNERIPFIDMAILADFGGNIEKELGVSGEEWLDKIESLPSPKILKSHLPFDLLPPNLLDECKVIMCMRNPKDTAVSAFHHEKLLISHAFKGDFQTYFNLLLNDLPCYSSYFEYTVEAWKRRDHPNLCIVFFEEMKENLPAVIKKVAKFLEKELTPDQIQKLTTHLSFKEMKQNISVNNEDIREAAFVPGSEGSFIRKGEVGDWKNYFTDDMNRRMDAVSDSHFNGMGLNFKYELDSSKMSN